MLVGHAPGEEEDVPVLIELQSAVEIAILDHRAVVGVDELVALLGARELHDRAVGDGQGTGQLQVGGQLIGLGLQLEERR
jgi:hypothetical protein